MRPTALSIMLVCLCTAPIYAQTIDSASGNPRKVATAVRVADGTIRLDGRLEEAAWQQSPAISDFTQKEPIEGAPAAERIEIRFAYDDEAVYVGARMYSSDPSTIQMPLGRRDLVSQAEHIFVSLDTYGDRRTAYTFGVTASGVRLDRYHPGMKLLLVRHKYAEGQHFFRTCGDRHRELRRERCGFRPFV